MEDDIFHLGIKALIRDKQGKILLLQTNTKDQWDLPGGKVKKGEDIKGALAREVEEETGIKKVEIIKLFDASISKIRISLNIRLVLFTYLCKIDTDSKINLIDDKHIDFKWCSPKETARLLKTKFADSLIKLILN